MRVLARRANGDESLPFEVAFHKIPDGRTIALSAKYANQYNAGGDDALIDSAAWQPGFSRRTLAGLPRDGSDGHRFDLGSVQDIRRVAVGFLRDDQGSWIMLPRARRDRGVAGRS